MGPEEIVTRCRAEGVRLVRFLYCDNGGVVRGKCVHVDRLEERLHTGVGITVAMQAMNSLDQLQPVPGMGPVGEVRLVPALETFTVLPYAPRSAAVLVDHRRIDGTDYPAGTRNFLGRMSERLAERGWVLRCAVENEFSLAVEDGDGYHPVDQSLCFSSVGMTAAADFVDALVEALEAQGINVEQYYPELGHGQQELSVSPRPALAAADAQLLVRETIRAVADRMGLVASLAPKPWPGQAGNGAHIHFSLWDAQETNLFHDPGRRFGLSPLAEQFVAGILAHARGLLALTAPSFNSYARLQPESWSSAFVCWGSDNREATVRVASTLWGREQQSTNLEFKPSDCSCNPYIAFGGLIAAGLDGIDRRLDPGEPLDVDPAGLQEEERRSRGVTRYPTSQEAALEELEADAVLIEALGGPLAESYLAVRRSEWQAYSNASEEFQFRNHFLKY